MAGRTQKADQARQEAALWLTLLNSPVVSATAIAEFRAWRSNPSNDAAYAKLESVWKHRMNLNDYPKVRRIVFDAQRLGSKAR